MVMKLTVLKTARLSHTEGLEGTLSLCNFQLHLMLLKKRTVDINVQRSSIQIIKVYIFALLRERNYSAQLYIYIVNFH